MLILVFTVKSSIRKLAYSEILILLLHVKSSIRKSENTYISFSC